VHSAPAGASYCVCHALRHQAAPEPTSFLDQKPRIASRSKKRARGTARIVEWIAVSQPGSRSLANTRVRRPRTRKPVFSTELEPCLRMTRLIRLHDSINFLARNSAESQELFSRPFNCGPVIVYQALHIRANSIEARHDLRACIGV